MAEKLLTCLEPFTFSMFRDGVKDIVRMGSILALSLCLEYLMFTVCVLFCSRLGQTEMKTDHNFSTSMFLATFCLVPAAGSMTVCNTYFSVGHGANLGRSQGIFLQKMVYLSIIASLLCSAVLINTEEILILIIDEPDIIVLVGIFIRTFIPATFAVFITIGLSRILQCRDKIAVTAIAAIVSVCFNILLNYILVYVLDMGFRGSAIAVVVAQYINCILLTVYVYKYEDLEFFSLKSLENWGEFFSIAVHGWLTYEIMQVSIMICYILSERFGAIDVAVFGAFNILAAYVLIMLIGFCVSLTIMVGHYLGQNDSKKAKIIVEIAFIFILSVAVVIGVTLFLLRDYAGYVYTNDREIIMAFSKIIFLAGIYVVSVTNEAIIKAILQAIGRQNIGALTSLISYSIGLVLAAVFAFKLHWKTTGLWAGIVMADGIEACILIIVLNNIDFAREAELALERCRVSEDQQLYTEIEDDDVSKETLLKIESNDEKVDNEDIKETRSLIENTEYKLSKQIIIIRIINVTIPLIICLASSLIYLYQN